MYWQKRTTNKDITYYSFIQWDPVTKKNIRLKQADVPANITSDKQADEFCRLREAETQSVQARLQQKLEWKNKFYNFGELFKIFKVEAMKRAPNSYVSLLYYLEQYGFDFFLNHKQCKNLNLWHLYYDDFRDWLMTTKTVKSTKNNNTLSYNSQNNIIGGVNLFLEIMYRKGKCAQAPKCPKHPKHLLKFRDASDVIDAAEAVIIMEELKRLDRTELSSDFFLFLLNSGLRLGEGLSISLSDFYPGTPENKIIKGALERHKLETFGYLSLESQLEDATQARDFNGNVPRKALKGRKRIDARSSRIIPILDKTTYNALIRRFNNQCDLYTKHKYGTDRSNYLLFDGLGKNRFSRLLREAYEKTTFKSKTPHCCRHTYATQLAGTSNADTMLCRLILGHKDEDTTLGYVHLFEQINRQSRTKYLVTTKLVPAV